MPATSTKDHPVNVTVHTLKEIKIIVRRATSASDPGLNGMPFWLYKTAPDVGDLNGGLLEWYGGSSLNPWSWKRARGIFILLVNDSVDCKLMPVCPLNAECHIFFSIAAQGLSSDLQMNKIHDISVQKVGLACGILRFSKGICILVCLL